MKRLLLALVLGIAVTASAVDLNEVDDLKPLAMRVYGVRKAVAESDTIVRIVLGASFVDARREKDAYRIISPDDPEYAYEKFVRPKDVKAEKESVEFRRPPNFWANNKANLDLRRVENVLTLPVPMKRGCHYSVLAQGLANGTQVTSGTCAAKFTYGTKDEAWDSVDGDSYAETMAGLRKVSSIGDGILLCEFGHCYSESNGKKLANWKVSVNGRARVVTELGRRSMVECYNPTGWLGQFGAYMYNNVYIRIGDELKDGDEVVVEVTDQITTGAKKAGFNFDSRKSVSRSIKVNQVGYRPDGLKVAYLAEWLGSMPEKDLSSAEVKSDAPVVFSLEQYYAEAGKGTQEERDLAQKAEAKAREDAAAAALEAVKASGGSSYKYDALAPFALRFKTVPRFRLCDANSGRTVFEGEARFTHNGFDPEGMNGDMCAENVYEIDFTAFTTPGRYYLSVDGVGRSYGFSIGDEAYLKAFRMSAQGMYEQRCGCELDPKLTGGWKRISCHDRGIVTTKVKRYLSNEWGAFRENIEMDPNPAYPPVKAAREKVENDPSRLTLVFETVGNTKKVSVKELGDCWMTGEQDGGNGLVTHARIDPAKGGTLSFWSQRIDSFGGNKWFGEFLRIGGAKGFAIGLNWGSMPDIGRINNGKWWHFVVRFGPADEKGASAVALIVDGVKAAGKDVYATRKPADMDDTIVFGKVTEQAAEGTYYRDIRFFDRALSDRELHDLTTSVPAELPHVIQAKGGHHDAGDYNPRSHIDVAQSLLYAYELRPEVFTDNQLPIPEQDNGIPDIVDEALWAVRLWEGLQCEDGGVYNGTESQGDPNLTQTVELDDKGDFAWAKDTKGTYLAAAIFAQSARVLAKCGKRDRSDALLQRARRAYEWAVKHPDDGFKALRQYGEYNHSLRAYAAAELYHATGEKRFHEDFRRHTPYDRVPTAELESYGYFDCSLAAYSYSLVPEEKCDPALRKAVVGAIAKQANMFIRNCDQLAFKFLKHPYSPVTWGSGAYENFAVPVAFMWRLTGDSKYRDWLIRTCDNTLGANPMGISWIVGLGERTVRCPLHNSRYRPDGVAVSGLQVQGPMQRGSGYCFTETCYPWFKDGIAKMHAFADVHFCIAMDEPTANNMANTMMIFGILCK